MLTFAYYLLKVLICSGILYGYYLLALRNKIFHSWNRFYLLAVVMLSLAAPLIKINLWQPPQAAATPVIHLLQVVNTGEEFVYNYSGDGQSFYLNASGLSLFIYMLISAMLFAFLIQTLVKINRLKYLYPPTLIEGINFRNTDAKGTPFSFFNNIFWNNKIDLYSSGGKQIFQHEVAHIMEKHSYDKIFMNIVLIFFWCNPIFWLIRKELNLIHEFIADKKAVEDNDTAAFAAMILQATYPQQRFSLTNNFFYSPLKRRLQMLTKNNNPKINYLSRLLVLPLAVLVFFAFTLKAKMYNTNNFYNGKKITVVIDAGHGGTDGGAFANNIYEKDITLSIAKEIRDLNTNKNINIVLTRSDDSTIGVKQRVDFAKSVNADFYISIHLDAEAIKNTNSGFSVLIPQNNNSYLSQSKMLGSDIIESFKNYQLPVITSLKQSEKGVWVLNANEYPAVLIDAGVLTTDKDLQYLIKHDNQKIIAQNILNGIEKFAGSKVAVKYLLQSNPDLSLMDTISQKHTEFFKKDTIPGIDKALIIADGKEISKIEMDKIDPKNIKSVSVLKGESAIKKYGDKGKNGVIEITMKENQVYIIIHDHKESATVMVDGKKYHPLVIIDNKEVLYDEMNKLNPNTIESVSVLKGESAINKYGDKGKNGVIEIKLKETPVTLNMHVLMSVKV